MDDSMDWEAASSPSASSAWAPCASSSSTSAATPYWTASSTPTPHGMLPGVGPFSSTTGYIALDTNVLIGQYALMTALHARLVSAGAPTCLLVGQQVMVELDGLSKSGDEDLSAAARIAIGWLDDKARGLRLGRGGRLRVESRAERADAAISTHEGVGLPARPDDAVLSSCMYFSRAARVTLWTNDRNLALLAEASGIPTLVGRRVGLPHLLAAAGVSLDAGEAMEIDGAILDDDDDDDDVVPMYDRAARNAQVVAAATAPQPPAQAQAPTWGHTPPTQTWTPPPPAREVPAAHAVPTPPPGSLADAIAALPSSRVPADVRADVAAALAPAHALLDPEDALPPGSRDVAYARAIADRLAALDASAAADSPDRRRILARAVASARTLASFLGPEPRRGERRLRPGEAADALTALADALGMMVPLDTARWGPLAARIRQLT